MIGWIAGKSLLFISSVISALLGALFGGILYIEAQIIDYVLSPDTFSLVEAPIVTLGWTITRDLANMFFIFVLLIIAFATVLKIKSYSINQLLWKIIVAALLINFSLVIAGVVLDFTQVATSFFIKQVTGGFGTVTTKLANSMQIINFYNPPQPSGVPVISDIASFSTGAFAAVVGIILTLIGLIITVFVFGATVVFLIIRIIWIWLLLIFAPLAWAAWIFPATSGYFSKWWGKFINWAFFAPVYAFMIYLSLSIFEANGKLKIGFFTANTNTAWIEAAPGLTKVGMPQAIFQWILVIALMFASLIVAQGFGVKAAGAAQNILKGWGDKTKGWAKGQMKRQFQRQLLGIGSKEARPATKTTPATPARAGFLVRSAQRLAAIPGGKLIAGKVFNMAEEEAKTVEAAQKQFANWTPDAIQSYLSKSPGRFSNALFRNQQMGAALALKEKGDLEKLGEPRIRELAALASREYPKQLDEILKVAPHLAEEFNKKIKAIVAKIDKANQIMLSSLSNSEVVLNLNPGQLKDVVQKADDAKVQRVRDVVNQEFANLTEETQNSIDQILAISNNKQRNRALSEFIQDDLNNRTATGTSADQARAETQRLEKIVRSRSITTSPAWDI